MPNAFAYVMIFSWPLVALVLFRTLPLHKALVWTIIGGHLILPTSTGLKLPMLPMLDKSLVPSLSALVLCLIYAPRPVDRTPVAQTRIKQVIYGLLALLFVAPILTVLQNPDPIIVGPRYIQGLRLYDAFSMISSIAVHVLPFFLGLRYLNTREAHQSLLQAFVVAALVYTLPALFEIRMSPQLNNWIYGFFPSEFIQHIRAGGFRPVVFLNHGLLLGIFLCLATLSALVLWREALRQGKTASGWIFAVVWLIGTLFLSKNFGALAIAVCLSLLVTMGSRRLQVSLSVAIAVTVLLYPMLRGAGWIPVQSVYEISASMSPERAESLKFRFDNEDALLAHANEKPVFGWGSWGRNQLYEAESGKMTSVTDGVWVILIGTYGWVGYVAHFGLLCLPIMFFARRYRQFGPSMITPGLMVVLSANLIDLLPNAGLVNHVWMMAGAMAGFVIWRSEDNGEVSVATSSAPRQWGATLGAATPGPSWLMASQQAPEQRVRRKAGSGRGQAR